MCTPHLIRSLPAQQGQGSAPRRQCRVAMMLHSQGTLCRAAMMLAVLCLAPLHTASHCFLSPGHSSLTH